DQLPDDHVLLQPEQAIDLALDRGIRKHLRRLLERRCRQERLGRERRLRDAEDQRLVGRDLALLLLHARVLALEDDAIDHLPRQALGVARVLDPHLLQHLADDQLDVLVVDVDALRLVDLLYLADEIQLRRGRRPSGLVVQVEQVGRVERALVERSAGLDRVAVPDEEPRPAGELVLTLGERLALLVDAVGNDRHLRPSLGVLDVDLPGDRREPRSALRIARLEDLDDAWKAVRDVGAGDAARVERPHRQLRAWLADRLRRDDADGVADLAQLTRREEGAVALAADAELAAALEHRAHRDPEVLALALERLEQLADA